MENPEKKPDGLYISYNDIAQYIFESLVGLGYAPGEDETLDLTDMVMDLILSILMEADMTTHIVMGMKDAEEE